MVFTFWRLTSSVWQMGGGGLCCIQEACEKRHLRPNAREGKLSGPALTSSRLDFERSQAGVLASPAHVINSSIRFSTAIPLHHSSVAASYCC